MRPLSILAALLLTASPATAGAIVNISTYWSVAESHIAPLPSGVTISCLNAAAFLSGCYGGINLFAINDTGQLQTFDVTAKQGFHIDNPLGETAMLNFNYSAFNRGSVGVAVDDPTLENAAFSSFMSGDYHSCDTAIPSYGTYSASACGVQSPDFSGGLIYSNASGDFWENSRITASLFGIGAQDEQALDAQSAFAARLVAPEEQTVPIPEPATMSMFAAALLAAFVWRQKRRFA